MPAVSANRLAVILTMQAQGFQRSMTALNRNVNRNVGRINRNLTALQRTAARASRTINLAFGGLLGFAGLNALVRITSDFSREFGQLNAILRTNEFQSGTLEGKIRELGRTTIFTSAQIASAAANMARAGVEFSEIGAILPAVLQLSQATATDLTKSTKILVSALRTFQLEAGQSQRVIDVLARQANAANTTLESLGEALSYGGPTAAPFGRSLEEIVALFGLLAQRGIDASRAGVAVRQLFVSGVTKFADFPGLDIENQDVVSFLRAVNEINLSNEELLTLLETRSGFVLNILRNSVDEIEKYVEANKEAAGTTQELAERIDRTLFVALKRVSSAASDFTQTIVRDSLGSANVASGLNTLARSINAVGRNFNFVLTGAAGILAFFIGPRSLTFAVGVLVGGFRLVTQAIRVFTTSIALGGNVLLGASTAAGFFSKGLLAAFGPAGVIGGVVALITYLTLAKDGIDEVLASVEKLSEASGNLTQNINTGISNILDANTFDSAIKSLRQFRRESEQELGLLIGDAQKANVALEEAFTTAGLLSFDPSFRSGIRTIATELGELIQQGIGRQGSQQDTEQAVDAINRAIQETNRFGTLDLETGGLTFPAQIRTLRTILIGLRDTVGQIGTSRFNINELYRAQGAANRAATGEEGLAAIRGVLGEEDSGPDELRTLSQLTIDEIRQRFNEYRSALSQLFDPDPILSELRKNPLFLGKLQANIRDAQEALGGLITPEIDAAIISGLTAGDTPIDRFNDIVKEYDNLITLLNDSAVQQIDELYFFVLGEILDLRSNTEANRAISATLATRAAEAAKETAQAISDFTRETFQDQIDSLSDIDPAVLGRLSFVSLGDQRDLGTAATSAFIDAVKRGDISEKSLLGASYAELAEFLSDQQLADLRDAGLTDFEIPKFWQDVATAIYGADQALRDFISNAIFQFDNLGDAIADLARSITSELIRLFVANPIVDFLSSLLRSQFPLTDVPSSISRFEGLRSILPGTGRAGGGRVEPGRAYDVGEHGIERFVPDVAGRIIPNRDLGGDTINITIPITVIGGNPESNRTALLRDLPFIEQVVEQAVERALRNPTRVRTAIREAL